MDKEFAPGIVPTGRRFIVINSNYCLIGRVGWVNGDPSGELLGTPFFGAMLWDDFGWQVSGYSRRPDEADAE